MQLEPPAGMRLVAALALALGAAGCPSTQDAPGDDHPDADPGTPDAPANPVCENPVASFEAYR